MAARRRRVAGLLHAQHAVEIARRGDRVVVEVVHVPDAAADRRAASATHGERQRAPAARGAPATSSSAAHSTSPSASSKCAGSTSGATMPDQRRAERAAERDHQVEAREVARRGLQRARARRGRTCRRRTGPTQNTPICSASSCVEVACRRASTPSRRAPPPRPRGRRRGGTSRCLRSTG